MAKPFEIPGLSEAKEFLVYLLKPEKLGELLKALDTREAALNTRIAALGAMEGAEAAHAQAVALLDEAREVRKRSDEEAAQARSDAAALRQEAQQEVETARHRATEILADVQGYADGLKTKDADLTRREADLAQARALVDRAARETAALKDEMLDVKAKLEKKLAALQAAAAE